MTSDTLRRTPLFAVEIWPLTATGFGPLRAADDSTVAPFYDRDTANKKCEKFKAANPGLAARVVNYYNIPA